MEAPRSANDKSVGMASLRHTTTSVSVAVAPPPCSVLFARADRSKTSLRVSPNGSSLPRRVTALLMLKPPSPPHPLLLRPPRLLPPRHLEQAGDTTRPLRSSSSCTAATTRRNNLGSRLRCRLGSRTSRADSSSSNLAVVVLRNTSLLLGWTGRSSSLESSHQRDMRVNRQARVRVWVHNSLKASNLSMRCRTNSSR